MKRRYLGVSDRQDIIFYIPPIFYLFFYLKKIILDNPSLCPPPQCSLHLPSTSIYPSPSLNIPFHPASFLVSLPPFSIPPLFCFLLPRHPVFHTPFLPHYSYLPSPSYSPIIDVPFILPPSLISL